MSDYEDRALLAEYFALPSARKAQSEQNDPRLAINRLRRIIRINPEHKNVPAWKAKIESLKSGKAVAK